MRPTIHVAYSRNGAGNSPMSFGIERGLFAARGIDLVMDMPMPKGEDVMRTLESGEAQIGTGSGLPILKLAMRGADPVVLMSIENENVFAIMGAADVDDPAKLRGTTVGICGDEDQDGIIMRRALHDWGLTPGVDVELQAFEGGRGAIWQALVQGEVSAMACTIPEPLNARARGLPILRDFMEEHEAYQSGSVVTTRRFLEEHEELVEDVITSQVEAIQQYRGDFDAALPHLLRCTQITDEEVLRQTHRLFGDAMLDFVPRPGPLQAVVRDVERFTGQTVDVDVERIVEPRFAGAVADRLGLLGPTRG
jgi:ABC-type nitrate/sulfonate/bicarbonate transport system substrate-binding protein